MQNEIAIHKIADRIQRELMIQPWKAMIYQLKSCKQSQTTKFYQLTKNGKFIS